MWIWFTQWCFCVWWFIYRLVGDSIELLYILQDQDYCFFEFLDANDTGPLPLIPSIGPWLDLLQHVGFVFYFVFLSFDSICYSMWGFCVLSLLCDFVVHCGTSVFCLCYVIFLFSQRAHVHASTRTDTHTHAHAHTHTHVHPFSSFNCHKCVDQSDVNGSTCCSILMFVTKCIGRIVSCILSFKYHDHYKSLEW